MVRYALIKVALVIDDPSLQEVVVRRLRQFDFELLPVESAYELPMLVTKNETDVVLLDIRLKGDEKLQILAELKKARPATEVILLSNHDSIHWVMEGMRIGAFDDIPEPFEVEILSNRILAAWRRKKSVKKSIGSSLVRYFEKTMMAATFAQAGEFETARKFSGKDDTSEAISDNASENEKKS